MPPRIGVMQGRMVPPEQGRFQSFPAKHWREEFPRAREAGIDCIEWIYEELNEDLNPISTDGGLVELRELTLETGIAVRSICADYFMTRPLIVNGAANPPSVERLHWLIERAGKLGITYIVLPFVDSSKMQTPADQEAVALLFASMAPVAQAVDIELHLETDLPPDRFATVMRAIGSNMVKVNYDIGNSASLGYDPEEEFDTLASWLGSVHVKDRVRGGGTVPPGTGDADFSTCFRRIRQAGFHRWFILQVARSVPGQEVEWIGKMRLFVEDQLAAQGW